MLAKTLAAAMAALVIGSATVAVARPHHSAPGYGYSYGYSYGEAPSDSFRDNACATGCGG